MYGNSHILVTKSFYETSKNKQIGKTYPIPRLEANDQTTWSATQEHVLARSYAGTSTVISVTCSLQRRKIQ